MRVCVSGSRSITNQALVWPRLDEADQLWHIDELVVGGARGADELARLWAIARDIPVTVVPAQWQLHGQSAGIRRNAQMAAMVQAVLIIWDGRSPGTRHMWSCAKAAGLPGRAFKLSPHPQPVKVLNRHTASPADLADAVYVGRGTPWGNPHHIGYKHDRAAACAAFEAYAADRLQREPQWLAPLAGHSLICSCAPLQCHADTLLRLAAQPRTRERPRASPRPGHVSQRAWQAKQARPWGPSRALAPYPQPAHQHRRVGLCSFLT